MPSKSLLDEASPDVHQDSRTLTVLNLERLCRILRHETYSSLGYVNEKQ